MKDMEPSKVLRSMTNQHLFTAEDESEIMAEKTREKQCELLLEKLARKGARAYETFKETIEKVHSHLKNTILNAENMELRTELRTERTKSADLRARLESAGNQTSSCLQCQKLEEALAALKTEMEQIKLKHCDEKQVLVAEVQDREEKLRKANTGLDPVQVSELERVIANLREENEKIVSTLHSDIEKTERNLRDHENKLVNAQRKNDRLTSENGKLKKQITLLQKQLSKIKTKKCETSEYDETKVELNRRLPSEIEEDLEKMSKALETTNMRLRTEHENYKMVDEELKKYKNAVNRAFLPSGKEFPSPTGVFFCLNKDRSVKLVASRSSEGPGKASDIFDHSKGRESGTAETPESWWSVDLGENCRLVITHCALRHGKRDSNSILRRWQLQGSIDGNNWTDLKKDVDPNYPAKFSDRGPYPTGRWSIVGEVRAFRFFRILQTGTHSEGQYGIYLSGLELYGTLAKL